MLDHGAAEIRLRPSDLPDQASAREYDAGRCHTILCGFAFATVPPSDRVIPRLFRMLPSCLITGEVAVALLVLSLFRLESKGTVAAFATSVPGWACVGACFVLLVSARCVWASFQRATSLVRRQYALTVAVNLFTILLVSASGELVIRLMAHRTVEGPRFANTLLFPRMWSDVSARHREVIAHMASESAYVVADPELGWNLAPNREAGDGLYRTSAEGLRSPAVGTSFSDPSTRLTGPTTTAPEIRIALLGDSMTFGSEVPCEASLPHLLQERLDPRVQVLNFGVPGYSAYQALLKYRRDIRSWKPNFVIMGITSRQLLRMQNVYNFLISPTGIQFPFARPRPRVEASTLQTINGPVPSPAEIFSVSDLRFLPYLEEDRFYARMEWPRGGPWGLLESSYLFRFVASLRPPVEALKTDLSDDALVSLTRATLQTFIQEVLRDGGLPILLHLPYQGELRSAAFSAVATAPPGAHLLTQAGQEFWDAVPCLIQANAFEEFAPGAHYTGSANAAVAGCLSETLRLTAEYQYAISF
ncbi:hypothetical protein YTPLAS18_10380 [Nitrospira sp.]|nr:hypothetical protein YTPLAS18_10380 [Nitrospira sp.]